MNINCPVPGSREVESLHAQSSGEPDRNAVWKVILRPSEVPSDIVEFVLVSAPWIWQEKRLYIFEAPSMGGVWTLNTLHGLHSAKNGLYTYQLGNENDSAYLEIKSHFCKHTDLYCDIHNPLAQPENVTQRSDTMKLSCISGGTRLYIYFIADDRTVFPVQSIEAIQTAQDIISFSPALYSYGGDFSRTQVIMEVQPNAVPLDIVEFVLTNDGIDNAKRHVQILESPAVGSGIWTIEIDGTTNTSSNGLYTYQLNGALLKLGPVAKPRLYMDAGPIFDLTHAVPGTRYILHWWPN